MRGPYHLGVPRPGAVSGFQCPRPVLDRHGDRVGWADSQEGPALVGPLYAPDLQRWERQGRYVPLDALRDWFYDEEAWEVRR